MPAITRLALSVLICSSVPTPTTWPMLGVSSEHRSHPDTSAVPIRKPVSVRMTFATSDRPVEWSVVNRWRSGSMSLGPRSAPSGRARTGDGWRERLRDHRRNIRRIRSLLERIDDLMELKP